jgi:hypothetical protein
MKLFGFEVVQPIYRGAVWAKDESDAEWHIIGAIMNDDIESCFYDDDTEGINILRELPKDDASHYNVLNPEDSDEDYEEEEE